MTRRLQKVAAGLLLVASVSSLNVSATTPNSAAVAHPLLWGICGHPTWPDYADWVPGNMATQIGYVRELGCSYYRCSFEGASYPAVLDTIVPPAQSAGITILPILPIKIVAQSSAETNYQANYQIAVSWATHAIAKGYHLPYWELGNELENGRNVSVIGDGALPAQYRDKTPGGFVAIASSLQGAYRGLKDAYAQGRSKQTTTLVPQVLYGCTYRHWGLLAKIRDYNQSMPCDIISWHWYDPAYGSFNAPIHGLSASFDRSPAECLTDFKRNDDKDRPMDVWITETNRSVKPTSTTYLNGSFSDNASGQDWAAQAQVIQTTIADLARASNVKAIFVYELLDESIRFKDSAGMRASEGNFGLVTGLKGRRKNAFYTYQAATKASL
jgi:hypothetical protein